MPHNPTLNTIGRALTGFSEGVRGDFSQNQARRDEQNRQLSDERRRALLADNRSSLELVRSGNIGGAIDLLQNRMGEIERLGGDPSDTAGQLNLLRNEQQDQTGSGGFLQEFFSEALVLDNRAVDLGFLPASVQPDQDKDDGVNVRASEILADGTTIQSTDDGVRVFSADGVLLEGVDVARAIRAANEEGIRITGAKAAIKKEADKVSQSIAKAGEAFDKIAPVRQTMRSIDQAIQAIDDGASTGVIEKFLPSVKAASIRLDTIMNQLGLDVVSSTTFGALSAGELSLALDTALPTGLEPTDLRIWLTDKRAAQQKLVRGLEDSAIFLMEGNTISDLVKLGRSRQEGATEGATEAPVPAVTTTTEQQPLPPVSSIGATDAQGFTIGGGGQTAGGNVSQMSDAELRRLAGFQ